MASGTTQTEQTQLKREVSLPFLVLYGLGTTIGAGIYALTGEVAGSAGMRAPLSFLIAALLAGITGLGFAELAGRLPKAAGEAVFVDHAFGRKSWTTAVGCGVILAGIVAAAAISKAFAGYVTELVDVPSWILISGLIAVLGSVAVVGIKESVRAAAIFTVIEIVGLVLVVWAGRAALGATGQELGTLLGPPLDPRAWAGVLGGSFLAFFAFLGFEDIDSVAEETENARSALPRAILITLAITSVVYVSVSIVAVLNVAPEVLANSDAPLSLIYERAGGNPDVLTVIAALAMVNGALVQLVMIPRVVYGMSNLGMLPSWAGRVSERTHTPVGATLAGMVVVVLMATTLELGPLARLTSAITMGVFVSINVALIVIKKTDGPAETFEVPPWLPYLGIGTSGVLFAVEVARLLGWT